jgi:hypothetical protein
VRALASCRGELRLSQTKITGSCEHARFDVLAVFMDGRKSLARPSNFADAGESASAKLRKPSLSSTKKHRRIVDRTHFKINFERQLVQNVNLPANQIVLAPLRLVPLRPPIVLVMMPKVDAVLALAFGLEKWGVFVRLNASART